MPHALLSLLPNHKDIAGPGSGASSLSLAAMTLALPSGTGSIIHHARTTVHLCPLWISPTTRRRKKMSLLPWWCLVMDFMYAGGVQVKTWGSLWRWPSQLRHLYRSCVQTYRLPWGTIKGRRGALVSMSDFVCLLWAIVAYAVNLSDLELWIPPKDVPWWAIMPV